MGIRFFTDNGDVSSADMLRFIYDTFEKGEDAAIAESYLPFLRDSAVCAAELHSDGGMYCIFRNVSERCCSCSVWERLVASVIMLSLLPVFVFIFIAVMLIQGKPMIFRQIRYGRDKCEFCIYKIRTMVQNGERLHPEMQRQWGHKGQLFKLDHDPRVTRIGAFLRAWFIDELPQLYNVIKGDMRFCGPRPLPATDNCHYTEKHHYLRLRGMPGITGLWQVEKRNNISFDDMCLLDIFYLGRSSLRMDLKILMSTLKLLFSFSGKTSVQQIVDNRRSQSGGDTLQVDIDSGSCQSCRNH
ncbi:MAG: sugar transferase [Kiritimatiellia bacterium]